MARAVSAPSAGRSVLDDFRPRRLGIVLWTTTTQVCGASQGAEILLLRFAAGQNPCKTRYAASQPLKSRIRAASRVCPLRGKSSPVVFYCELLEADLML